METLKISGGIIPLLCSFQVCTLLYRNSAYLFAALKYHGIRIKNFKSYLDVDLKWSLFGRFNHRNNQHIYAKKRYTSFSETFLGASYAFSVPEFR
jgi:hypothetical protein